MGALLQRRGGTARHDAVAWGYARAAENLGVDIIQNCEVKGINITNGTVTGLETTRGSVKAKKVGLVPAGHSSVLANMAGFHLPINSVPLQALVSEPIKPILDCVIMSNAVHVYVSQSDKGEIVVGAGSDAYNSYSQRGSFDMIEHIMGPLVELFPIFSRLKIPANLVSIMVLRINLTRRKYCLFISASRFEIVSRFVLSPLSKEDTTSVNIPSAIELIRFKIFCGFTDVSSSKN